MAGIPWRTCSVMLPDAPRGGGRSGCRLPCHACSSRRTSRFGATAQ
jgi:hypothetical protein